jgi:hypothetical protein
LKLKSPSLILLNVFGYTWWYVELFDIFVVLVGVSKVYRTTCNWKGTMKKNIAPQRKNAEHISLGSHLVSVSIFFKTLINFPFHSKLQSLGNNIFIIWKKIGPREGWILCWYTLDLPFCGSTCLYCLNLQTNDHKFLDLISICCRLN